MDEYKSEVKRIPYPVARVYAKLSDLSNLGALQETIDRPDVQEAIKQRSGGKATQEQIDKMAAKIKSLTFTPDSISGHINPMGDVTLLIVDREPEKTVKFSIEGVPVLANLWIQLLPEGEGETALRVVAKADLNFFIKKMVGDKLEKSVKGLANMLAEIPY